MIKVSHTRLIFLSGGIWLAIGLFLFFMGLNFLVESILKEHLITMNRPLLDSVAYYVGGRDTALLLLIFSGLLIGFVKGRFIFGKTVEKSVNRILSLPNPTSLGKIYPKQYYLLLGAMFLLGFLVKFAPLDIRGEIDLIIGFALLNGACLYFYRAFLNLSNSTN
jgi:hypothetical protein